MPTKQDHRTGNMNEAGKSMRITSIDEISSTECDELIKPVAAV
jgi:hypothetical protein